MADKELGALSPIDALLAAALFHTVQQGNSRKVTAQQIADFVNGNYPSFIQTLLSAQSAEDVYEAIGAAPEAETAANAEKLGGQLPSFFASAQAVATAFAELTKADVGLGNVDNTSDANKPVSIAQQAALDSKITGPAGGVNPGDIVAFANSSGNAGNAGRKATQSELKAAIGGLPIPGYISPSFNLSNNAADSTNDLDFPAGIVASEQASPILMNHAAAATAQLDVAYGTGNGGRFDSAISDGTWHCFIISNGTTVSRGLSKSVDPTTQPYYPAGFTHYRRVASWLRIGGSLAQIKHRGDEFLYVSPVGDKTGVAALTNVLLSLSVPTGISVQPLLRISFVVGSGGFVLAQGGDGDYAAANNVLGRADAGGNNVPFIRGLFTNLSGQIRYSLSVAGTVVENNVVTVGWVDTRGRI